MLIRNLLVFSFSSIILPCFSQSPESGSQLKSVRHDTSARIFTESGLTNTFSRKAKAGSSIEQMQMGTETNIQLVTSFDGLGYGFSGPQGTTTYRNPSDNSLAVGPNHIVQTVNARMAIFSKKGAIYDSSGKVLYGPVETRNVFKGFGGPCEKINNGDAVVRYDQLADRWLIVMPTFRRASLRNDSVEEKLPQPGAAVTLFQPPLTKEEERKGPPPPRTPQPTTGSFCMCYAISTGPDPFGPYYRYEFKRDLFPDYPRPAIWPDGYYTTTSTGDEVSQRHAYVVDRNKMLKGEEATEQFFILNDVNFIIHADLDGKQMPPKGAPAILLATGGDQLKKVTGDDGIYVWKHHVDWENPERSTLEGPIKISVAPYDFMGGGQLTKAVPQPGTTTRLDAQGDKLMARLVYRRIGNQESIVGVHSVATSSGTGGVRWYEFRVNRDRSLQLYQQGTYTPNGQYRWMASAAMDKNGSIGIGYSFGDSTVFPGQRFAARRAGDKKGILTNKELILVEGQASQTTTLRWEDYTQTAIDPSDDQTIWYVGDYLKTGASSYSTRIGAFVILASQKSKVKIKK